MLDKPFDKVLITNRGAIVTRIQRTLARLGIESVVVYAEADRDAPYVHSAGAAYSLGEGSAADTYLDIDKLIDIARHSGAQAIHPGYGFLSENAAFIEACEAAGLVFLGPTAEQVRDFGLKHRARLLAERAGVPLVPGSELLASLDEALAAAERIGYPVMLKSSAGGGDIGMQACFDAAALTQAFERVRQASQRNFGDAALFVEAYVADARHIEVQLFGDGEGRVVTLGERDCSTQRRHQKVIEECPAPNLPAPVRMAMLDASARLGETVRYRSAGTVEFIYDPRRGHFYFLEVNTRLQVEHGVTEMVWGVDLIEWMLRLGAGALGDLHARAAALAPHGHAIQARLYAEAPHQGFRPSAGLLTEVTWPSAPGLRIDQAIEAGFEVSAQFDPMLAKLIQHADSREQARQGLASALAASRVEGIATNRAWLVALLDDGRFAEARMHTRWLDTFDWAPRAMEVLSPGTLTTVQDLPGRQGYWHVGVPPSGPFDDLSFRLGNRLLDNSADAAGLEITFTGPTLRFHRAAQIVLSGAPIAATLDGAPLPSWQVTEVAPGAVLTLGRVERGARAYLLVRGGIDCPRYLGSRATFTLGRFGGHAGRALRSGDLLALSAAKPVAACALPEALGPSFDASRVDIAVLYGPHGSPDFFTDADIDAFFAHDWEVHYNSSRTGVRLIGPHPEWARADGGEAGLHPSNIHDNAYAFGSIDFTGDMPVVLGPDGPSLGGFVCPAVVVRAERWKLGQLAAGDRVRFVPISIDTARALDGAQERLIAQLAPVAMPRLKIERGEPLLREVAAERAGERIVYRRAGDDFVLIEFGAMVLDIALRLRVHAWMEWLHAHPLPGLKEMTPGIRSLQLHFEPRELGIAALLAHLAEAEIALRDVERLEVESRLVHLPLSWDDPACREATDKYQRSVRPDAPWCPSNLEFIRRINGLDDIEAVRETLFSARYLVMGLGDVYLGAPVASPLDPRHRLVTTKYNPARTWTAENSVGIGGAYLCVYGMEGPGGYQLVGRTLQMWNRYRRTAEFDQPWLLRFFDQLQFFEVSAEELELIRRDFPHGRYPLRIERRRFRLSDLRAELESAQPRIDAFRARREAAFQAEMTRWRASGQFSFEDHLPPAGEQAVLASGEHGVESPVAGSLWQLLVAEGERVEAGQPVALVESMKMEIEIIADRSGQVVRLPLRAGSAVAAGQPLVVIATD